MSERNAKWIQNLPDLLVDGNFPSATEGKVMIDGLEWQVVPVQVSWWRGMGYSSISELHGRIDHPHYYEVFPGFHSKLAPIHSRQVIVRTDTPDWASDEYFTRRGYLGIAYTVPKDQAKVMLQREERIWIGDDRKVLRSHPVEVDLNLEFNDKVSSQKPE